MRTTVALTFPEGADTDVAQIGDFLFLFRAAYTAALGIPEGANATEDAIAETVRSRLREMPLQSVTALFVTDLGDKKLIVRNLGQQSPLNILLEGIPFALTAAVILSGGTIAIPHVFEANVRPLGAGLKSLADGIKRLRDAISGGSKADFSYGPRPRHIKLNKTELYELLHHSGKGQGGFQNLVAHLQKSVNRATGVLTVSEADIDRIQRYGKNKKKGGWQASFHKIFGRHFDFGG